MIRTEEITTMQTTQQDISRPEQKTSWRCAVCGFVFEGEKPPKGCPVCHSPSHEFIPQERAAPTHV